MLVKADNVKDLIKDINQAKYIAMDTETVSLEDKTIVAFSIATENETYFIPVRMNYFINISDINFKTILKEICNRRDIIFHNYSFDGQVLAKAGYFLKHTPHDTLIISHLLDENNSHKLKDLVKRFLDYEMIKYKEVCGTGKKQIEFSDVDDKELAEKYASDDATYTLQLFILLYNKLRKNKKLISAYKDVERPLLDVVLDMHLAGVPINKNKINKIKKTCISKRDYYKSKLDIYMKDVNLNSPKQLKEYFIDKKHMPIVKRSRKTKEPSVDKEVLEKYADRCREADWILKYRYFSKIVSTFIPALTPDNGRIFPTFHQVGTTSGRFSSSNPNFQNIPAHDEFDIRDSIQAEDGKVFVGADYCVSPKTKILKTDLSWRDASNINVGDELIGFDEHRKTESKRERTKFRKSIVIGKKVLMKPCYKITTDRGEVISSNNHLWVGLRKKKSGGGKVREWLRTDELTTDDSIAFFVSPWKDKSGEPENAYLAGFFDGEGWLGKDGTVGWGQKGGIVLDYVNNLIDDNGYNWNGHKDKKSKVYKNYFTYQSKYQFLGECRPRRLLKKSYRLWEGKSTWNRYTKGAKIKSIEYVGIQKVIALETTTKTFIANGFLSHNCQMELRLAANFSQDKRMMSIFNTDLDIHTETANKVGCPRSPDAKTINFGILYGMGVNTLAKNLNKTRGEAGQYMKDYYNTYPDLRKFMLQSRRDAYENRGVDLLFGRVRHLPSNFDTLTEWQRGGVLRSMTNAIIQGSGAEILKIAMNRIYKEIKDIDAHIIATIHDEVIIECSEGDSEKVKEIVERNMIFPTKKLSVTFKVDVKIGRTWSEIH